MIESTLVEIDGFNLGQVEDMNGFEVYEYVFHLETDLYYEDEEA